MWILSHRYEIEENEEEMIIEYIIFGACAGIVIGVVSISIRDSYRRYQFRKHDYKYDLRKLIKK